MPEGIAVVVDDEGFATIDFLDSTLRGPGVDKLIKIGGPETVEKLTPNGRPVYRVPEGNARAAGFLSKRKAEDVGSVVHVAADGTETPSVPDADGMHTLVVGGPVNPDAEQVQAQQVIEPQVSVPVEPATQENTETVEKLARDAEKAAADQEAAAAAVAAATDNGGQTAPEPAATPEAPAVPAEKKYPEGEPTTKWHLPELKAYAADHGKDAEELRTKAEVLELINSK